jgi:hypothetical protein
MAERAIQVYGKDAEIVGIILAILDNDERLCIGVIQMRAGI